MASISRATQNPGKSSSGPIESSPLHPPIMWLAAVLTAGLTYH
jgi:hypothetical protein